jgi:endonuclease/exonuclease/phosphatase family metal-dependent hydrolase
LQKTIPGYSSVFAPNYEVPFVPLPVYEPMGKVSSGIALFSGMVPDSAIRYAFPGNYSWPMGLFFPDRCFILSYYRMANGKTLVVVNTHNSAFDDGSLRDSQMEYLSSVLLEEFYKGYYVVAGGDWNLNPPEFHTYLCKTGDAHYPIEPEMNEEVFPPEWNWVYDPYVPSGRFLNETYLRSRTYTTTLDYFLVSPNVEVIEIKCFDLSFENSDHHPVALKVRLI